MVVPLYSKKSEPQSYSCFAGKIRYKGGMAPRQKISSASRWLINIGLTLQFYIPCALFLFCFSMMVPAFFTTPSGEACIVHGIVLLICWLTLAVLIIASVWCCIYWLWNRYGNRFHALYFLVVANILVGALWFWWWLQYDPIWTYLSPAPLIIPTLLYVVALQLLTPKNTSDVFPNEPQV